MTEPQKSAVTGFTDRELLKLYEVIKLLAWMPHGSFSDTQSCDTGLIIGLGEITGICVKRLGEYRDGAH